MVAFNTIKVGDVLWQVLNRKQGNTTIRKKDSFPVVVKEIATDGERIFATWNGNPPKWMYRREIAALRRSPYKPREKA